MRLIFAQAKRAHVSQPNVENVVKLLSVPTIGKSLKFSLKFRESSVPIKKLPREFDERKMRAKFSDPPLKNSFANRTHKSVEPAKSKFESVAKRREVKSARLKLGDIAAGDLALGREVVADDDGGDAVIEDFVLAFA